MGGSRGRGRLLLLLWLTASLGAAAADSLCDAEEEGGGDGSDLRRLKVVAIFSILAGGVAGMCFPLLGKVFPSLGPESSLFFALKAFAAGIILGTAFVHILPEAFDELASPCLPEKPWQEFPFAGFTAMVAAIGTLTVDYLATGYFGRMARNNATVRNKVGEEGCSHSLEEEATTKYDSHFHIHAHGPADNSFTNQIGSSELLRHRIISQVLELGIVVHSVIIGISLGASKSSSTIKPLIVALTFHQLFEGIGLGSCIAQTKFKWKSNMVMALFFSLTAPIGIVVGIGISSGYNDNHPITLAVGGLLNAAAAGILVYMALVDLAADFMSPKVQNNGQLQFTVNVRLLLGVGLMSLLAKWA